MESDSNSSEKHESAIIIVAVVISCTVFLGLLISMTCWRLLATARRTESEGGSIFGDIRRKITPAMRPRFSSFVGSTSIHLESSHNKLPQAESAPRRKISGLAPSPCRSGRLQRMRKVSRQSAVSSTRSLNSQQENPVDTGAVQDQCNVCMMKSYQGSEKCAFLENGNEPTMVLINQS